MKKIQIEEFIFVKNIAFQTVEHRKFKTNPFKKMVVYLLLITKKQNTDQWLFEIFNDQIKSGLKHKPLKIYNTPLTDRYV